LLFRTPEQIIHAEGDIEQIPWFHAVRVVVIVLGSGLRQRQ